MDTFTITMVGASGSGKTVFSAALCKLLVEGSVRGFTIVPVETTSNNPEPQTIYEDNLAVADYMTALESLRDGEWPENTGENRRWTFRLSYLGTQIAEINWMDYKGGYISNSNLDSDAGTIYSDIFNSDAVMFFVDGWELTNYGEDTEKAFAKSGASRVKQLLNLYSRRSQYIHQENSQIHSIAASKTDSLIFLIVVTKCDSVLNRYKGGNSYSRLLDYALNAFSDMKEVFAHFKSWKGGAVAVSGMGEKRVNMNPKSSSGPEILGDPSPINVETAFFYCMYHCLNKRIMENSLEKRISEYKSWLNKVIGNPPPFSSDQEFQLNLHILKARDTMREIFGQKIKTII